MTTKYVRSEKQTAFKDGIIFSGRIARFFLDQMDTIKKENQTLKDENRQLKNQLLQYSQVKVKIDNLEAENKTKNETLSRLRLL